LYLRRATGWDLEHKCKMVVVCSEIDDKLPPWIDSSSRIARVAWNYDLGDAGAEK